MNTFRAFRISVSEEGRVQRSIETCNIADLPDGDVLIKVAYSSLNYKDALSANGHRGITRKYPHTPGIDVSGKVVSDQTGTFTEGESVVVIGFDLGMNTWGGFGEYVRVPATWVLRLPEGLSPSDAMRIGTAGVTAAYCVEKLLQAGLSGSNARVLVTGATGGVGSIATHLLATLGYQVTASSGKPEQADWLMSLGAKEVIDRHQLSESSKKALLAETYDAAVDSIGQDTLVNVIKSLKFGGSVAACGIVGGTALPLDIYPFILRGVNLLGVASADAPLGDRQRVLVKYASLWKLPMLEALCDEITLNELDSRIEEMLAGKIARRALVRIA
ncbi:MAG: YhdH/YhfP family quinone oxidoreductase [Reinekea sp.]|jgi:acrylyl-CoA reductase (NADPH)